MIPTVVRERMHRIVWQGAAGASVIFAWHLAPTEPQAATVGILAGFLFLAVWGILFYVDRL